LVDAHGSGPCASRRGSSSLLQGTIDRLFKNLLREVFFIP
jgi:hypothetical protein